MFSSTLFIHGKSMLLLATGAGANWAYCSRTFNSYVEPGHHHKWDNNWDRREPPSISISSLVSSWIKQTPTLEEHQQKPDTADKWWTWKNGLKVGAGVGLGVGAVYSVPILLGVVGFTAAGVVKGSIAAKIQSKYYGGATGGIFSILQSAGAAGLSWTTNVIIGATGAVVGFKCAGKIVGDEKKSK